MTKAPYRRIHVVINPASGKDEPILNVLNDVFREHGVDWDISLTHKYGDATAQARAAIAAASTWSRATVATAPSTRSRTRS